MGKPTSSRHGFAWALIGLFLGCLAGAAWALPATGSAPAAATAPAPAAATADSPRPLLRPHICLVLSGGGARGMAHIGVLKVLEDLKIPIDCIAGTSMGAVVGGLYASGMSARDIESTMRSVDWQEAFRDSPPRRDLAFRRKQDDRNFLVRLPLGLKHGQILLPKGFIQGQKLEETLRQLTLPYDNTTDFDQLPTPFRAVATDLTNGNAVLLDKGDLAIAMRASISAPGVFAPVDYEGRLLVDGGLVENLPINVARAMHADILIVSDVSYPLQPRSQLDSALSISNQMLAILVRKDSDRQKSSLSPQDILIEPILGATTSTDFTMSPGTISSGETAARQATDRLAALAVGDDAYRRYVARRAARQPGLPVIEFVRVDQASKRYEKTIMAEMRPLIGKPLNRDEVGKRITELYGLGNFETLDYGLVEGGPPAAATTAATAATAAADGAAAAPAAMPPGARATAAFPATEAAAPASAGNGAAGNPAAAAAPAAMAPGAGAPAASPAAEASAPAFAGNGAAGSPAAAAAPAAMAPGVGAPAASPAAEAAAPASAGNGAAGNPAAAAAPAAMPPGAGAAAAFPATEAAAPASAGNGAAGNPAAAAAPAGMAPGAGATAASPAAEAAAPASAGNGAAGNPAAAAAPAAMPPGVGATAASPAAEAAAPVSAGNGAAGNPPAAAAPAAMAPGAGATAAAGSDASAPAATAPAAGTTAAAATGTDETGLEVHARRKSWGPNYVRFGLNLQDDFQGNSHYNAAARFLMSELNQLGAELLTDVQIGNDPRVMSEFYQPLDAERTWFVAPSARIEARDLAIYSNNLEVADYRDREAEADLDIGRNLGNWGEIRMGLHRTNGLTRERYGAPGLVEQEYNIGEFFFKFSYDQLDNVHFPRAGETFTFQWDGDRTDLGSDIARDRVTADWQVARSAGRNTVLWWTSAGSTLDGNVNPTALPEFYSLGGFFNLSGLAPQSLIGPQYAITRVIYFRKIGRGGEGLFEFPAYIGGSLEFGKVWDPRGVTGGGSLHKDASLFFAIDTFLGPVYLGTGYDEHGTAGFYLFLGRTF